MINKDGIPSSLLICSQKNLAIHVNLLYTCKGGKKFLQLVTQITPKLT